MQEGWKGNFGKKVFRPKKERFRQFNFFIFLKIFYFKFFYEISIDELLCNLFAVIWLGFLFSVNNYIFN